MSEEQRGVLVTGGTGALGRSVVERFLASGDRVHVSWLVEEELAALESFLGEDFSRVRLHEADLTREEDVRELFGAIGAAGGLSVSAHIVGGFAYASLEDTDTATWHRMLEMNATTCFLCCRAAAGLMAGAGGSIINVSAVPALLGGAAYMGAYSAAKAAVLNLTESLARELAPARISVNAIAPSSIDTPANREAMPDADTSSWLSPAEIAAVIGFLASPEGRIVTGSALALAGSRPLE